jgi:hypothetical protein
MDTAPGVISLPSASGSIILNNYSVHQRSILFPLAKAVATNAI